MLTLWSVVGGGSVADEHRAESVDIDSVCDGADEYEGDDTVVAARWAEQARAEAPWNNANVRFLMYANYRLLYPPTTPLMLPMPSLSSVSRITAASAPK